jgi:uncharacterized protein YggT (Ycf19 family)
MTGGVLLRSFGYVLSLGTYAFVFLLALEWLVHSLPGVGLNPLRKMLFQVAYPILRTGDRYFPLSLGNWNGRGLLLALVLWVLAKGLIPWVVWAGFALKG